MPLCCPLIVVVVFVPPPGGRIVGFRGTETQIFEKLITVTRVNSKNRVRVGTVDVGFRFFTRFPIRIFFRAIRGWYAVRFTSRWSSTVLPRTYSREYYGRRATRDGRWLPSPPTHPPIHPSITTPSPLPSPTPPDDQPVVEW